jgi:hypothetical protein
METQRSLSLSCFATRCAEDRVCPPSVRSSIAHQALHRTPSHGDSLAPQLFPDLLSAVHAAVLHPGELNRFLELGIVLGSRRWRPSHRRVIATACWVETARHTTLAADTTTCTPLSVVRMSSPAGVRPPAEVLRAGRTLSAAPRRAAAAGRGVRAPAGQGGSDGGRRL